MLSPPQEIESYEVKVQQAHDAINVCKALLIKHNYDSVTQARGAKPSDVFGQSPAVLWPSDMARLEVAALILPHLACNAQLLP
jgi:hypothetical protein